MAKQNIYIFRDRRDQLAMLRLHTCTCARFRGMMRYLLTSTGGLQFIGICDRYLFIKVFENGIVLGFARWRNTDGSMRLIACKIGF